jgi:predicted exporter
MKVNIFNVAASVLVIGLSIDYGVFMAHKKSRSTDLSVITSAITTVGGFGALALAHHPAMFSLGITVVLGIIPSMICALIVLPALQGLGKTD